MSVVTLDLRQSLAYTNTVSKPVKRKAHHTQFPETPLLRTISVTRFGVSVEKVVATIENPNSHHGILELSKLNVIHTVLRMPQRCIQQDNFDA